MYSSFKAELNTKILNTLFLIATVRSTSSATAVRGILTVGWVGLYVKLLIALVRNRLLGISADSCWCYWSTILIYKLILYHLRSEVHHQFLYWVFETKFTTKFIIVSYPSIIWYCLIIFEYLIILLDINNFIYTFILNIKLNYVIYIL